MKKLYATFLLLAGLSFFTDTSAQCTNGQPGGTTAYDTTIVFPFGVTRRPVKFPKFNPQAGMVTCVKLIVTINGVIDTVNINNYSDAPQTTSFTYSRTDKMIGPGLTPILTNTYNQSFGPYGLAAYDNINGIPGNYSRPRDTVFSQTMTRTLTDSTEISQFYGPPGDSVVYDYQISASVNISVSGGSANQNYLTSAFVRFRFEYCTCPLATLPVGLKNFSASKQGATVAGLYWEAEAGTDNYYYEIEVSRDGHNFTKTGTLNKQVNATAPAYQFSHAIKAADYGRYYYRVKQRWYDGYYRYSETRSLDFANPLFSTVSVYPNPSSGAVGIKFVAAKAGRYSVQVSNAAGQIVSNAEWQVAETDFKQLAPLQKGMYYVKITDLATGANCLQQLVVQ